MARLEKQLRIGNKLGLHARAAMKLVELANQFEANITLCHGDKQAAADSVLAILVLETYQGQTITIITEGKDAHPAMAAVENLIAAKFDEAE